MPFGKSAIAGTVRGREVLGDVGAGVGGALVFAHRGTLGAKLTHSGLTEGRDEEPGRVAACLSDKGADCAGLRRAGVWTSGGGRDSAEHDAHHSLEHGGGFRAAFGSLAPRHSGGTSPERMDSPSALSCCYPDSS